MKRYRLIAYIRVEPENQEPMTFLEALSELDQQVSLFPENIYRIEKIESETPTDRKEAPCIPPESRKN
jgi:hypothetical protein